MFLFRDKELILHIELRNSLNRIYGVGFYKSCVLASRIGFCFPFFIDNLNRYYFSIIFFFLRKYVISEVRIQKIVSDDVQVLKDIRSFKGIRHSSHLPVRGHRTRTNASTRKIPFLKNK